MKAGSKCPGAANFLQRIAERGKFIWANVLPSFDPMEIRITGKNMSVTEGIKEWVFRKASKFERYVPRIVESHVLVKKEKYYYVAEITVLAKHLRLYGEGRHKENLYTAIDEACARVTKQLRKFREKIKSHHLVGGTRRTRLVERLKEGV